MRLTVLVLVLVAALAASVDASRAPSRGFAAVPAQVHLLNRTSFSPTAADLARLRRMGSAAWLRRQLHPPREGADPALEERLALYPLYGQSPRDVFLYVYHRDYSLNPDGTRQVDDLRVLDQLTEWRLLRAVDTDYPLREVMVEFWFNHFNVFWDKGAALQYAMPEYVDRVIRRHALGRFRDLLGEVARSVPMLSYLDNDTSSARAPGGPNENYARELMELHTLGVDAGYTQQDVREVAACFSGWTVHGLGPSGDPTGRRELFTFRFDPERHDYRRKVVLGTPISGFLGQEEGERVLDLLARHPATARRLSRKLARRFLCDDPPEAVVEQAAEVFRRTDGDIARVVECLLESPEFDRPERRLAKLKTPFEVTAGTLRALEVPVVPGTVDNNLYEGQAPDRTRDPRKLEPSEAMRRMGAPMFEWLTPDGYPDRFDDWSHPAAMFERLRFAQEAARRYGPSLRARRGLDTREAVLAWLLPGQPVEGHPLLREDDGRSLDEFVAAVLASPEFQRR